MRTTNDVFRTVSGAAAGTAAAIGVCVAVATLGHATALDPVALPARLSPGVLALDLVAAAAAALTFAWLYAKWFDALLSGPAVVRGLKFGLIAFVWSTGLALVIRECGLGNLNTAHPMLLGVAALAAWSAFGAMVGLVYGAGRQYHAYRSGMGYGLPDRRSIV